MRETSLEAYYKIKEQGLLSREQTEIYYILARSASPMTSGEVFNIFVKNRPANSPLSQSRARFTALRNEGAIREAGTRKCNISGKRCIVWEITGELPVKNKVKAKSRSQKKRELLEYIETNDRKALNLFNYGLTTTFIDDIKEMIKAL